MSERFNAHWLMQQQFPPIKYVVPGIVPEGMTLLVAAPKIGKSWLALGLALALSNGSDALGCLPVGTPRPVLYLALEDGQRRLQDRLRSLRPEIVTHRLQFMTNMGTNSVIQTIRDYMDEYDGLDPVVILDTLGKVMPPAQGNQSAYGHDYKMLSALKATSDAVPGSSLLIVHHTRKAETGDFLDSVSGTQGIAGAADTVLMLKRNRNENRATLYLTSRDAAEGEYGLTLSNTGAWTLDGGGLEEAAKAAAIAKAADGVDVKMTELISEVGRHPQGVQPKQVAEILDWDAGMVRTYLRRATESGRILSPSRGIYTPVTSVTSVTSDPERDTSNRSDKEWEAELQRDWELTNPVIAGGQS